MVNVNPLIDKEIEGVYDGPLVNAVRTLGDDWSCEKAENPSRNEADYIPDRLNEATVSFQGNNFSYTNALINARKQEGSSAYHKKQVNFFKKGGVGGLSWGLKRDISNRSAKSNESGGSRSKSKGTKSKKSL